MMMEQKWLVTDGGSNWQLGAERNSESDEREEASYMFGVNMDAHIHTKNQREEGREKKATIAIQETDEGDKDSDGNVPERRRKT